MLKPLLTSNVLAGVLLVLLLTSWLRTPRGPGARGDGVFLASGPDRLAAYEEIWAREESALWDWLDERLAMPGRDAPPASRKHRVAAKEYGMAARLAEERMDAREVDDAIRVTQERLSALRAVAERRKAGGDGEDPITESATGGASENTGERGASAELEG